MAKILLDTSVYIPLFRSGRCPGGVLETEGSIIYLSAVVAQELYAGAGDNRTIKALDQLCYVFQKKAFDHTNRRRLDGLRHHPFQNRKEIRFRID